MRHKISNLLYCDVSKYHSDVIKLIFALFGKKLPAHRVTVKIKRTRVHVEVLTCTDLSQLQSDHCDQSDQWVF